MRIIVWLKRAINGDITMDEALRAFIAMVVVGSASVLLFLLVTILMAAQYDVRQASPHLPHGDFFNSEGKVLEQEKENIRYPTSAGRPAQPISPSDQPRSVLAINTGPPIPISRAPEPVILPRADDDFAKAKSILLQDGEKVDSVRVLADDTKTYAHDALTMLGLPFANLEIRLSGRNDLIVTSLPSWTVSRSGLLTDSTPHALRALWLLLLGLFSISFTDVITRTTIVRHAYADQFRPDLLAGLCWFAILAFPFLHFGQPGIIALAAATCTLWASAATRLRIFLLSVAFGCFLTVTEMPYSEPLDELREIYAGRGIAIWDITVLTWIGIVCLTAATPWRQITLYVRRIAQRTPAQRPA